MNEPYLIQRMEKPFRKEGKVLINPFNFGGGFVNGGFSKAAWDIIKEVVAFDYMGSAEFEFGDVPRSFGAVAQNHTSYIASEIIINKTPVYYVCHKDMEATVKDWLGKLSKGKCRLKDPSNFERAVGYLDNWDKYYIERETKKNKDFTPHWMKTIGWIDIRNHYMFFTDKEVYDNVVSLFRIGLPDEKVSLFKKIFRFLHLIK